MQESLLRKIAEGIVWGSSSSILLKGIWFLAALVVVAKLSLHEFGTYQITLSAWVLVSSLLLVSADQVFIAKGAQVLNEKGDQEALSIGSSSFLFRALVAVPLWAVLFFGTSFFARWYSGDILEYLKILSFILFVLPFDALINYDLSIRKKFFEVNLFVVGEEIIKVAGIMLVVFWFKAGVAGLLWTFVIAAYIKVFFFYTRTIPYIKFLPKASLKPFFSLFFSVGKWNIANQYAVKIAESGRIFFIQYFVGREAVALFSLAQKLFSHMASLFPMRGFLIPLISGELDDRDRLRHLLERGIKYSVPLFTVMAAGAAVVMPFFLGTFFPKYLPSLPLFYVIVLYFPFVGVSHVLSSFLFSQQEQKAFFLINLTRYILMVPILPFLLIYFGIIGTAIEFLFFSYLMIYMRYKTLTSMYRELKINFEAIFKIDDYDRQLLGKVRERITIRRS